MAIEDLLGAAVRIRRGRHGGMTAEVVSFEHRLGPPPKYTEIKVKLGGSGRLLTLYSLDELERLPDPPSVPGPSTAPPELPHAV